MYCCGITVDCCVGLIWSEVKQLWDVGLEEYAADMWNVIDFITNSLYVATVALRCVSFYKVRVLGVSVMYCNLHKNNYLQFFQIVEVIAFIHFGPGMGCDF